MADIVIYTRAGCGYCWRAKRLLDAKGVTYREIDVGTDPESERKMVENSGDRQTVPQIFIDGRHVGDSTELIALERSGALDRLLAGGSTPDG